MPHFSAFCEDVCDFLPRKIGDYEIMQTLHISHIFTRDFLGFFEKMQPPHKCVDFGSKVYNRVFLEGLFKVTWRGASGKILSGRGFKELIKDSKQPYIESQWLSTLLSGLTNLLNHFHLSPFSTEWHFQINTKSWTVVLSYLFKTVSHKQAKLSYFICYFKF